MSVSDTSKTIEELDRLREMKAQLTDPLAAGLLEGIIVDLEAELAPLLAGKGTDVR